MHLGAFARNVVVLAGGTVLAHGLTMLASPLITRLYTPHDFGILSVNMSIVALLSTIASLRYEAAIPLPTDDESAAALTVLCLGLVFGTAFISSTVIFAMGETITRWVSVPEILPYLWLLPLGVFGLNTYSVLSNWAIRKQKFGLLVQTKLAQSVGQVVTQVTCGLLKMGPLGLLLGDIVGRSSGSIALAKMILAQAKSAIKSVSISTMKEVAKRYQRFPLFSTWSAVLSAVGMYFPLLLVTSFYGTNVSGWLSLGLTMLSIPLILVSASVSKIYLSEAAKITKSFPDGQLQLFWRTIRRLSVVVFPTYMIGALLAPWLLPIVFGYQWAESARYLQVLTPMFFFMTVGTPVFLALDVLERQDIQLICDLIRIPLMLGPLLTGCIMQLSPLLTLSLYSCGTSLYYLSNTVAVWNAIKMSGRLLAHERN